MRVCSLKSCPNSQELGDRSTSIHMLSKHETPEVQTIWREFCKSSNKEISLCANHFTRNNFVKEDVSLNMRRRLKRGAIPTITGPVEDSNRKPAKRVKLEDDEDGSSTSEDDTVFLDDMNAFCSESETDDNQDEVADYNEPDPEYLPENIDYVLESDSDSDEGDEAVVEGNLDEKDLKIQKLERTVAKLKERQWNPSEEEIFQMMKKRLAKCLTENQLNYMLKRKQRVNWNRKELSRAFGMRSFGGKAYNYVRKVLKCPLPSTGCMRRWASKINVDDENNSRVTEILAILHKKTKLRRN